MRLRAWRDELERAGAELGELLTEVTDTTEDETRPAMGSVTRVSRVRQRESVQRALDRAEKRAKALRADLGLTPASRGKLAKDFGKMGKRDLALEWADEDERESAR